MRDLERAETITGDFLLVSGDVIANIALEPALVKHRARREKDKNAIMTIILKEAGARGAYKSNDSLPVFVIDTTTERCLHYEEVGHKRGTKKHISLEPEILNSSHEVEVRQDLIDCRIDLCTQDVLLAWSDNFDFTTVRKSFLRGVLKDYETYGKTVHTHVVGDRYAARVKDLRAYDAVSRDITGRWTFPFCPDSNLSAGHNYRLGKGKNYLEDDVIIEETVKVRRSIIGRGTSIGHRSEIIGSTLGQRCKIGEDVIIEEAYIWDDVTVEDGTTIRQAVVANQSTIGKSCKIESSALISYKARLPGNLFVSEGRRVITEEDAYHPESPNEDKSDVSSTFSLGLAYRNTSASSSISSISTLASLDPVVEPQDSSRRGSFRSELSDDTRENRDFHLEATASILDGLQKGDPPDTIILELNGYRMSTNASQHEVRKALVAAFIKRISNLVNGGPALGRQGISAREAVKDLFAVYKTLVERTLFDQEAALKVDQVDLLLLFQAELAGRPSGDHLMLFVAKEAYDQDILEEDGILQWWDDVRSKEGDLTKVRGLTEQFITYLQEAEEEDESDEDDADEEDD